MRNKNQNSWVFPHFFYRMQVRKQQERRNHKFKSIRYKELGHGTSKSRVHFFLHISGTSSFALPRKSKALLSSMQIALPHGNQVQEKLRS